MTLNFNNVGGLFEPVPDGLYKVRITGFDDREGQNGPWSQVHMMICEGDFAENREISDNWFWGEKALWRTKKILETITGSKWDQEDMEVDTDEFIGLEFAVLTEQQSYVRSNGQGEGVKSQVMDYYSSTSEVANSI